MKKILVLLLVLLLLVGCKDKEKEEMSLKEKRVDYIEVLETVNDKKKVVRFKNEEDEVCYYVYDINNNQYDLKVVTLHDDKDSYNVAIEKYEDAPFYNLVKEEDILITEITLQKNKKMDTDIDGYLEDKYKDKDEFKILE